MTCSSYFKAIPQIEQLPELNHPCEWSAVFFYLRRNNLRPKQLACWPPLYSDAFENIDEPRTPYSVMIAETISSACFVLLASIPRAF